MKSAFHLEFFIFLKASPIPRTSQSTILVVSNKIPCSCESMGVSHKNPIPNQGIFSIAALAGGQIKIQSGFFTSKWLWLVTPAFEGEVREPRFRSSSNAFRSFTMSSFKRFNWEVSRSTWISFVSNFCRCISSSFRSSSSSSLSFASKS